MFSLARVNRVAKNEIAIKYVPNLFVVNILILQFRVIFRRLKLWIAVARHKLKCILIAQCFKD